MLKVFNYSGSGITFDFENETYVNATEMAKPFGKRVSHFLQLKSTQDFISVLKSDVGNPVITRKGNFSDADQGTWMHELLALEFAGWLAPAFKIWCNQKIKELLTTGQSSVPMSMEDMMISQLQAMKEQKARLETVENDVKYLKNASISRPDYFTVVGFASYNGMNVGLKMASSIGRKASQFCKTKGIPMDEIPDPRFGVVRMYPRFVLEKIFSEPIM